jgi:DNA polymerase III epsilon subunit-like protein
MRDVFLAHLTHLAKLAQVRQQKQLAFTFYRAIKQLKLHDAADAIERVDDLQRVKGIGPFVLKHIANREKKLVERAAALASGLPLPKTPRKAKPTVPLPAITAPVSVAVAVSPDTAAPAPTKKIKRAAPKSTTEPPATPPVATTATTTITTTTTTTATRFSSSSKSASDPAEMRRVAIEQCRRLAETKPIFIDTETTGFARESEILEIAAIDFAGNVLFESLARPVGPIEDRALAVHGISLQRLLSAPAWPVLWPQVRGILSSAKSIAAYNAPFDRRLLRQTNARHSIPEAQEPQNHAWICLQQLMMRFAAAPTKTAGRMRQFSLAAALELLQEQSGDAFEPADVSLAHRALADAHNARRLFLWIAEQDNNSKG